MAQSIDLQKDSIKSTFFKCLAPGIAGLIVKSVFIIVDSIFIGRGVGPMGLAALSLTLPFFTLFSAIAMMVGIGGAAKMSIQFGKGDIAAGQGLFQQSMVFITLFNLVLVALSLYLLDDIIALMGATGELAELSVAYMEIILVFFVLFAPAWVLSGFVRNDANPALVMYAMIAAAVLNIILDYLFIFEFNWGIRGGALATGISQATVFIILLVHFIQARGKLQLQWPGLALDQVPSILKSGLPIFFTESAGAVTVTVFNYVLLAHYTEQHVTAYSIIANLGVVALFMMVGIGQACQPIISYNFGAGRLDRIRETLVLGLKFAVGIGLATTAVTLVWATEISALFIADNQPLVALTSVALQIYFFAPPLFGLNMVIATLFQAVELHRQATLLSLARGIVLVLLGLLILPLLFPVNGIWGSVLFAEAATALLSLYLMQQFFHAHNPGEHHLKPALAGTATTYLNEV